MKKIKIIGFMVSMLLIVTSCSVAANNRNINKSNLSNGIDDDWPMFHHDLNNTAFSTSETPNTDELLWTSSIIGSTQSSPAIYDGKMFIGSEDGDLYCLDAKYGIKQWNFSTGAQIESSPAVSDGKVYFGSMDNHFYCIDAQTSSLIWRYSTGGIIRSSPAVYDGKVYIASVDKKVYCFDADPSDGIDEGYDDPDGVDYDIIWIFQFITYSITPHAVYDDKLIIGVGGTVCCLDAIGNGDGTTELIWTYGQGSIGRNAPAIYDDKVYIGTLYCIDINNGSLIWSDSGSTHGSPAIAYDRIYSTSRNNITKCYDADPFDDGVDEGIADPPGSDYDLIWSFETGDRIYSSPAIADGKVYIPSNDGNFYCINATTGIEIWNHTIVDNYVYSSPAIAYGYVYFPSDDGNLYCFGHNEPPDVPDQPTGPTEGQSGEEYEFSTNPVTDPEGDPIFYLFDWGNGEDSGWIDTTTANYTWFEEGTYEVKVKAKDIVDKESDFSDSLEITIKGPRLEIESIRGGFFGLKVIVKNNGTDKAQNVKFEITYFNRSMILLWPKDSVKNGTISIIFANRRRPIISVPFGIGGLLPQLRVPVTIKISIPELQFELEKIAYTVIIGTFVLVTDVSDG